MPTSLLQLMGKEGANLLFNLKDKDFFGTTEELNCPAMTNEPVKPSILLVEDEENLHEALKLNLELEGYEVTSAYDGSKALLAVQNEYFDLIILDIMLPEIDGITAMET